MLNREDGYIRKKYKLIVIETQFVKLIGIIRQFLLGIW